MKLIIKILCISYMIHFNSCGGGKGLFGNIFSCLSPVDQEKNKHQNMIDQIKRKNQQRLYVEEGEDDDVNKQISLGNKYFTECKNDTDLGKNSELTDRAIEGVFGKFHQLEINDEVYTFMKIKIDEDQNPSNWIKLAQREINMSQKISYVQGLKVQKYIGCYVSMDDDDDASIIIQYESLQNSMQSGQNVLLNTQIKTNNIAKYFFISEKRRQQNFLKLLSTLSEIHAKGIYLNSIEPSTIYTNKLLKNIQQDQIPNDIYLYFGNFEYISDQVYNWTGNVYYKHPNTYSLQDIQKLKINDIFALCLSYFQIEYQKFNTISQNKLIVKDLYECLDQEDFQLIQENKKLNQEQYNSLLQNVFEKFMSETTQHNTLQDFLQGLKEKLSSVQDLVSFCQCNFQCIMFAGLVDDIEKFPNIDIIIESILYCNSNSNRII